MSLYHRPRTGRPVRVAWALEEIGVDHETVALSAEERRDDAHVVEYLDRPQTRAAYVLARARTESVLAS
jgi:hypothetical protein